MADTPPGRPDAIIDHGQVHGRDAEVPGALPGRVERGHRRPLSGLHIPGQ